MTEVGYFFSPIFEGIHTSGEQFQLDDRQHAVIDNPQEDSMENLTTNCPTSCTLEHVLNHLSSDDICQSMKGWNSGSPSSSESAESFPSSSFQSPRAVDLSTSNSHLPIEIGDANTRNAIFSSSNLLPSCMLPRDCVDLDNSEVLFRSSPTHITRTFFSQHPAEQSEDESTSQRSAQMESVDHLYTSKFTAFQDTNTSTNLLNNVNQFVAKRPHTLQFGKWNGSPSLPEQPLSFTSSSSRFEEQLASVDHAWFGALDMPNFSLEEVDLLLSPGNRLQSPNLETMSELCSESKIARDVEEGTIESQDLASSVITAQNTSGDISRSTQDHTITAKQFASNTHRDRLGDIKDSCLAEKDVNSDDTLTCSEAEYYMKFHSKTTRKYRKRSRQLYRLQEMVESSESEGELTKHNTCDRRRRRPVDYQITSDSKPVYCLSTRKLQNAQADAGLKPWWPKNVPLLYRCDQQSDDSEVVRQAEYLAVASPASGSQNTEANNEVEHESDLLFSDSHISKKPHSYPVWKSNDLTYDTANKCPYEIRSRRRRKQMELWQFILCRLQTARNSAFQWVNPSTGVFRIVDTLAGAKEWGRYRSNNRMDYEKMARAMRFYYKDSILRKARQQLHFQFAMPYVEWANKYYQCRRLK